MFYKLHSGIEPTKCFILMFVSQVKTIKSEKNNVFCKVSLFLKNAGTSIFSSSRAYLTYKDLYYTAMFITTFPIDL